jgi:hypothetical protein
MFVGQIIKNTDYLSLLMGIYRRSSIGCATSKLGKTFDPVLIKVQLSLDEEGHVR